MVKNKVILITGAAQGIGFEIAKQFHEKGARIVLTVSNEEQVKTVKN